MKNIDADKAIIELEDMYPHMVDEKDKQSVRFALEVLKGTEPTATLGMNEYQALAQRTSGNGTPHGHDRVLNGILGLAGEAGECADIYKKVAFQGHTFIPEHLVEELGDVLWYCAELATGLGYTLEDVAKANIDKLKKRYPEGFDPERSIHREDETE